MEEETASIPSGTLIGDRYRVEQLLGRGGMGAVYAGRHLELHERVAIKFLHKEHAAHADRFFREARAASRIRSEHVVRIFDVGRLPGGEPYIVMEHLEGVDLGERIEKSGTLDLESAADILIDVCEALAHAHALGIVHRDLKPANIFLAREASGDLCVKLLDFGVAKVPDAGSLTRTATLLGSPVYMSPEQLMGSRGVDARSDIWSLGIVLFELFTNTLPFEGETIVHQGILVREMATPRVTERRSDLPVEVEAVIARCLGKEPRDRFQDVADLAAALAPFASEANRGSVPRIRRILSAVRESKPNLASTLPFDEDAPASTPERASKKSQAATRISGIGRASPGVIPAPPLSDPVALTASHAQSITTVPDARAVQRRRLGVLAAIGAVLLLGGLLLARDLLKPAPMQPAPESSHATAASLSLPLTPSAAPPQSEPSAPPAAPPSAFELASAVPSSTPRAQTPPRHPSKPAASASTPAQPAPTKEPNCNPPFFVNGEGHKIPKPECMR